MNSRILLLPILLASQTSLLAGTISGTVNSSKTSTSDLQGVAVVWVEGLPASDPKGDAPVMSQSGVQFLPRVLTVVAGQTVTFPNEDDVAHNVFSLSAAKKFKLGIYPKGDTRDVSFEKPGIIDLFCSIHRHMHAVIVVTPNEFFAQTELGKPFAIENVPAGEYTIKTWNAAHKIVEQTVSVPADGDVQVTIQLEE